MQVTEQTTQQIERSIKKIAQKLPANEETSLLTDIHLLVSQDSGELIAYDDNDQEITRCVVEQWIDNKDESFYDEVTAILRKELHQMHEVVDNLGIMKPYSFVSIILGGDLMEGLDQDLDSFFDSLMKG